MTKSRRTAFTIFSLLIIAGLLALGSWQIHRMQWKRQLIAHSKAAVTAKPVSINDIAAGIEYGYGVDWLRIKLTGSYRHDLERYMYAPKKTGQGYQVITPFLDDSGFLVFVDRGWVSEMDKNPASRKDARKPENTITITGITRLHEVGIALFMPDADSVKNVWYWYDRKTLAALLPADIGKSADGQLPVISQVFVQVEPKGEPGAGVSPQIAPVEINLPDNHLQYAITWFTLSVFMLAMLVIFLRANKKPD